MLLYGKDLLAQSHKEKILLGGNGVHLSVSQARQPNARHAGILTLFSLREFFSRAA